ncbi:MAG: hypothetical protein KDC45_12535 [Bacteroidetes bacterium]|nr:hypothetical protein [Bacteroidota bacterium]
MKEKPPTADEVFVNLIRVAREDAKIGKFVRAIVDMGDFDRKSVINTFIHEMALKGAPAEFIKAVAALRDSQMAAQVKILLLDHKA